MTPLDTKPNVSTKSEVVLAMEADWAIAESLLEGTACMRLKGEAYLPKWPNEDQKSYEMRIRVATLFPAFKRTVETLAARPFSKPVTVEEGIGKDFELWFKNIDMAGRTIDQFGFDAMRVALGPGLGGILAEHPIKPENVVTKADETAAGMRPYLLLIDPTQILGWRSETKEGAHRLTMLRIMECVEEIDGEWLTKEIPQVRVLEPGKWTTHRKNAKGDWAEHETGFTTLMEIPFAPFYGERIAFMQGKPPLMELAHLNVKHWQSQSDQDTILHVARVPILVVTGVTETEEKPFELTIGSSAAVKLPDDAKMEYVEHSGAAIDAGKTSLDGLKEEMRQSGAELLVIKPGPTTATEVATDNAVGMCALQRTSLMMQDALNQAIRFMAQYAKQNDGKDEYVKLFMDFAAATLAEASASMLIGLSNGGTLSRETLINELKRRGILASDVTWVGEQVLIELEGPGAFPAPPAPPGAPVPPKPVPGPTPPKPFNK